MQTTDCRLQIYFSHLFLVAFWVLLYDVLLGCKDCANYFPSQDKAFWVLLYDVLLAFKDCASYFHRNLIFLGRETLFKKCTHTK